MAETEGEMIIHGLQEALEISRGEREPTKVHTVYVSPIRCHTCEHSAAEAGGFSAKSGRCPT